jgi:hypothetical protein
VSALAEALVAAQRRALAALEKAYVAEKIDKVELTRQISMIGLTDTVDGGFLLASLDVLREWGAPLPATNGASAEPKKATEGQVSYIVDLLKKGNHGQLFEDDLRALTFDRASALIDALKAGSYNPSEWELPF